MKGNRMQLGIGQWVTRRAFLNGGRTALISNGAHITYADLDRRTNQVAAALIALGVRKGDRVAMLLVNSTEFIEVLLGCAKMGALAVPLNVRLAGPGVGALSDGGADPAERAVRLSLAIDHVIDVVHDATGAAGEWHPFVCDGVAWLFEHRGVERPDALAALAGQMLAPLCAGPGAPPGARHRACDDLAGTAVLASLAPPAVTRALWRGETA